MFSALQNDVVTRLQWDAYFSSPTKPVTAIAENRLDLISAIDTALGQLGACVVVTVPRVSIGQHGEAIVAVTLAIQEFPLLNRDASGTQKTALQIAQKCMSLLREWTPDEDVWSALEFQGLLLADTDEHRGLLTWTLDFTTVTVLETVMYILANEDGQYLVNEHGQPFIASPTEA